MTNKQSNKEWQKGAEKNWPYELKVPKIQSSEPCRYGTDYECQMKRDSASKGKKVIKARCFLVCQLMVKTATKI